MIKYAIYSIKRATTVIEAEVREVSIMEDCSLSWRLQPGESLYEFISPKVLEGERWFSWFLYDSKEVAMEQAIILTNQEAERTARKSHTEIDQDVLAENLAAIKFLPL